MIKETCSCGASFETDGPKAEARVEKWRSAHLHAQPLPFINVPSVWHPNTWPPSPAVTYTTTNTPPRYIEGNVCAVK